MSVGAGLLLAWLAVAGAVGAAVSDTGDGDSIAVTVRGTLHAGRVAIGGETTGYTITARGVTWELDFGADERLRQRAETLDGKKVRITGSLEARAGVEIKTRSIVKVDALTADEGTSEPRK
jgi:hypothetical protein